MVFRGKGSPFCEGCRRRRIKCDEARPSCSQCVRVGLTCSGYRGKLELLFHDETTTVSQRCKELVKPNRLGSDSNKTVSPSTSESLSFIRPAFDVDEAGRQYFRINFSTRECKPNRIIEEILFTSKTSLSSIASAGLVLMARVRSDGQLMGLARTRYTAALRALSSSIQSQKEVEGVPRTIASLQLTISEMFMSNNPDDIHTWTKHLGGLTALFRVTPIQDDDRIDAIVGLFPAIFTIIMGCLVTLSRCPPPSSSASENFRRSNKGREYYSGWSILWSRSL
ncbi:Zn(II)2Cys6 transcription factor domain-containing protein [Aspergillus stella-maris]|uniref:Zn(II)2Cys6 transcription factor domain-containing protein n=1 Tax=Aspergillus stella-maris TaxID=1810926 RepID=UPI003CCD0EC4